MKSHRRNLRTTQDNLKEKLEVVGMGQYIHPPIEQEKMNQILTSIAEVDKKYGTIYVNNTGNFLIRSIEGYIAIFILYDWTTNVILTAPIKDIKDETTIEEF